MWQMRNRRSPTTPSLPSPIPPNNSARDGQFLLPRGKFDPESTSLSGFRFHAARTAHALHSSGDDCQTNSGPFVRSRRKSPFENPENLLMSVTWNADAFVTDPNTNPFGRILCPFVRALDTGALGRTEYQRARAGVGRFPRDNLGANGYFGR